MSAGDGNFTAVTGGGTAPQDITPNVDSILDGTGYTSVDTNGLRRFTEYSGFNDESFFTDASGATINPTNIVSAADYFFYDAIDTAYDQTTPFLIRDFTGGGDVEYVQDTDNFYLINAHDICFVHTEDQFGGSVFFVADEAGGASDILFKMDPHGDINSATKVLTVGFQPVVGATNLRAVANGQLFRVYFTAPVNPSQNAEYLPKDKHGNTISQDFGTEPWSVSDQ